MDTAPKRTRHIDIASNPNPREHSRQTNEDDGRERKESRHSHSRQSKTEDHRMSGAKGAATLASRNYEARPRKLLNESFLIDVKGDPLNQKYGTPNRSNIPPYHRIGLGSVLGFDRRVKIDRNESHDRQVVLHMSSWNDSSRKLTQWSKRDLLPRKTKLVAPSLPIRQFDHNANYVHLGKWNGPKTDAMDLDFRNMSRKPDHDGDVDSDLENASDSDSLPTFDDPKDLAIRTHNVNLARLCKAEPDNLGHWLDFIEYQDKMIRLGTRETLVDLSDAERRSLAEVKISIYKDALAKTGDDRYAQETLWLGMLYEGAKVWDSQSQHKKWDQAVQSNPRSIKIPVGRLNAIQCDSSTFRYEQCKAEYIQCLANIKRSCEKGYYEQLWEAFQHQMYLIIRLTRFMSDAGYHESSIALWQAVIEFLLFRPRSIDPSKALMSFEAYWDSEVSRVGEVNWVTWPSYDAENEAQLPDPITIQNNSLKPGPDLLKRFIAVERQLEKDLQFPGRTIDNAAEDDPFHVVLFSDLETVLSTLCFVPNAQLIVIPAFLCYCGLPPLPNSQFEEKCVKWWLDPFIKYHGYGLWNVEDLFNSANSGSPFPGSWRYSKIMTDDIFSHAMDVNLGDAKNWISNILEAFVQRFLDHDDLCEYLIAFKLKQFGPSIASKDAKRLIKLRKSCLRLYSSYAISEHCQGKVDQADMVFTTAISMIGSDRKNFDEDVVLLWHIWIWQKLDLGQANYAIHLLLSLADERPSFSTSSENLNSEFFPSSVLKIVQRLNDGISRTSARKDHVHMVLYVELLALFSYFQHGSVLTSAIDIFRQNENYQMSQSASPLIELLHQSRTRLFDYHSRHVKPFRPSEIKELLSESVQLFPGNTTFLEAYAAQENCFTLNDRLKNLIANPEFLNHKSLISQWLFAIWSASKKRPELGGTLHGVRALLERAVTSDNGIHCQALWSAYIMLEHSAADFATLKTVFFHGITKIPWSKSFVLQGLEVLSSVLGDDELKKIYQLLEQREMRVHSDIWDVLNEMDEFKASTH